MICLFPGCVLRHLHNPLVLAAPWLVPYHLGVVINLDHRPMSEMIAMKSNCTTPWNGRFYFWHKHHLFVFVHKHSHGELSFPYEEASISYFGRNPNVLMELLDECRRHYLVWVENNTYV